MTAPIDPTAAKALIAEGRKHDVAMTAGPLRSEVQSRMSPNSAFRCLLSGPPDGSESTILQWALADDADGFAWLRNHAASLLDGYEQALQKNEQLEEHARRDRQAIAGLQATNEQLRTQVELLEAELEAEVYGDGR